MTKLRALRTEGSPGTRDVQSQGSPSNPGGSVPLGSGQKAFLRRDSGPDRGVENYLLKVNLMPLKYFGDVPP